MEPHVYYQQRLDAITLVLKSLKSRLRLLGSLRLLVFLAMGFGVYFFFGQYAYVGATLGVGIVLFLLLVNRYSNTQNAFRFHDELRKINETELKRLQGDLTDAETGNQYIFEEHDFNQDIDLFGHGSLFQWLDRTALTNGQKTLANWFNSNNIDQIEEKQAAVQELKDWTEWRQEYTATAAMIASELQTEDVLHWMQKHKPFVPKIHAWLPIVFSSISGLAIIALSFGIIPWIPIFIWLGLGFAITGPYVKRITDMYNTTSKIDDLLRQYSKLLLQIEEAKFQSVQLQKWQKEILTDGRPASVTLNELSKEIDALGNRNNLLMAFVGNGLLLWDLRYTYRIEKWMKGFNGALEDWFEVIERMDAMNSLANYAFNHPNYIYPKISEDAQLQLAAKSLGHPLLEPKKVVTNDITLRQEDFFIITGANMAGKSTFLRTVAMNIVMANSGLPVCAASFEYRPVKLISSMRTSDSLVNDESYFFSELKRLKYIVNKIETDTYFIILDEILKGTNSVDKAEGSKKFVERLVKSKSTGLIATHDLSLCTLADKYTEIQNHYFDAEIVNDELFFDYRFKDGICQNMNASFLLRKMQIVEG
ncbi:MAG: DNA mismatch repair protein MutS [bacterium]|nr:DNA mismatch repair protein MutS [bacterium]